jgi:hypothetical protein
VNKIGGFYKNMDNLEKELLKLNSVKGEIKRNLKDCLLLYKKDKMISMASNHGLFINSNKKKEEIAKSLEEMILKNFVRDLEYFQTNEIKFLKKICEQNFKEIETARYKDYNSLLFLGYMFFIEGPNITYAVIPDELAQKLPDVLNDKFWEKLKKNQKIYKYLVALVNLYGVFHIDQFLKIWNLYEKDEITLDDILHYLDMIDYKQSYFWSDRVFVISDYFEEGEYVEHLDLVGEREYYSPSKEEVDFYFKREVYDRTPYYKKLKEFLKEKAMFSGVKVENLADNLLNDCSLDTKPIEMLKTINEAGFEAENIEDMNELLKLIINLSNNTRKWILRGYTSRELFEKHERKSFKALPDKSFFIGDLKVGRNEPCKCGSGIKHKKCCGRLN